MNDSLGAKRRERRREETQPGRRRETERPKGDQSGQAAETRRREVESDRQTELACRGVGRRDPGLRRKGSRGGGE